MEDNKNDSRTKLLDIIGKLLDALIVCNESYVDGYFSELIEEASRIVRQEKEAMRHGR